MVFRELLRRWLCRFFFGLKSTTVHLKKDITGPMQQFVSTYTNWLLLFISLFNNNLSIWFLTLTEDQTLRIMQNTVLGKTSLSKRVGARKEERTQRGTSQIV